MPEGGIKLESFTVIFIDFLLIYENRYYLQVYLNKYAYKIVNTEFIYYLDDKFFEADED